MPVCDDDLLDAGVELCQGLFQTADVFRHSRLSGVYQQPSGIRSHISHEALSIAIHIHIHKFYSFIKYSYFAFAI